MFDDSGEQSYIATYFFLRWLNTSMNVYFIHEQILIVYFLMWVSILK